MADLAFWKGGFIFSNIRCWAHTAADKVYAFESMKSWHTLAINMITVSVALTLLEIWIQTT